MKNKFSFFIIRLILLSLTGLCLREASGQYIMSAERQNNPPKEDQTLYNGVAWRNLYYYARGDQFLFTKDYLPGSLTIGDKYYPDIDLDYDIYDDQILTMTNHGSVIRLNKEMVDSFSLVYNSKRYQFINILDDSISGLKGYVNVLYKGKSALYVKYRKEIELLAIDDKYDLFYQMYRIYFVKNGDAHQINGINDFFSTIKENKVQVKDYMKKNKLKVSKKEPGSFIPLVRFYDSISQ